MKKEEISECEQCGKTGPWISGRWGWLCPPCEHEADSDARAKAAAETYGPGPYPCGVYGGMLGY